MGVADARDRSTLRVEEHECADSVLLSEFLSQKTQGRFVVEFERGTDLRRSRNRPIPLSERPEIFRDHPFPGSRGSLESIRRRTLQIANQCVVLCHDRQQRRQDRHRDERNREPMDERDAAARRDRNPDRLRARGLAFIGTCGRWGIFDEGLHTSAVRIAVRGA